MGKSSPTLLSDLLMSALLWEVAIYSWKGFPSVANLSRKFLHRPVQRCFSQSIPDPIKLSTNINLHRMSIKKRFTDDSNLYKVSLGLIHSKIILSIS